jgi:hypothetical protein
MRAKGSLEQDIMLGQVAGHRRQGKPRLWWHDSIKDATDLRLEASKETVQDRKKWCMLVELKSQNRECTNVKWTQEKAMANHSWTTHLAYEILHRITRSLNQTRMTTATIYAVVQLAQ